MSPLMPQPALVSAPMLMPGAGLAFQYTFDSASNADANPGSGLFRSNNASFGNMTTAYISSTDGNGQDVGSIVGSVLGGGNGVGIRPTGTPIYFVMRSLSAPSTYGMWLVTSITTASGYFKLGLKKFFAFTPPPTNARDTVLSFQIGGTPPMPVWAYDPTSTDTTVAPGSYTFTMNTTFPNAVTQLAVDGNTTNQGDWSGMWINLHKTSGPVVARLVMLNMATVYRGSATQSFLWVEVNSIVDQGTWQQVNVTYVDTTNPSGASPLGVSGDPVAFNFQWVGVGSKYAPTLVKTGNYTAKPNDLIPVDTTSTAVTVTLPTAPVDGTTIIVKCVIRPGTNDVTVARGGTDVFNKTGGATSLTLNAVNQGVELQYNTAAGVWYVIGSITT